MKTKGIALSILASTLVNIPTGVASKILTAKEAQRIGNVRVELIPVKTSKNESKGCLNYKGTCLLPISKKPAIALDSFEYKAFGGERLGIQILVGDKAGKAIEKASRKHINNQLALVVNGKVIVAPHVKSILKDGELEMTFGDQESFERVLSSLKDE